MRKGMAGKRKASRMSACEQAWMWPSCLVNAEQEICSACSLKRPQSLLFFRLLIPLRLLLLLLLLLLLKPTKKCWMTWDAKRGTGAKDAWPSFF